MNIKYITSEMGFKGKFPKDYPYMRVFESQIYYLDATHLPITEILMNDKKYDGDLWWNIGKGGFEKQYISYLFNNFQNTTELLKRKFDNVFKMAGKNENNPIYFLGKYRQTLSTASAFTTN